MSAADCPNRPEWHTRGGGPAHLLSVAADSAKDLFSTMMDLTFDEVGSVSEPDPDCTQVVGCIPVTTPHGGWNLAVATRREHSHELVCRLLGMDPDEEVKDEVVSDALGEIVNLLVGAMKSAVGPQGSGWQLGLPMYLEGTGWFMRAPKGFQFFTQRLESGAQALQLIICWRQR